MRARTFLVAVGFALIAAPAAADITPYHVNFRFDFVDPDPGDDICGIVIPGSPEPLCSLRAAIQEANRHPDDLAMLTLVAGTHVLSLRGSDEDWSATGDLDIKARIVITGVGPSASSCPSDEDDSGMEHPRVRGCAPAADGRATVIRADHGDRVFQVFPHGALGLASLTVTGGRAPRRLQHELDTTSVGGAIVTLGVVFATQVGILNNEAQSGGGIFITDTGEVRLNQVTLRGNRARLRTPEGCGGGIMNLGLIRALDTLVLGNDAGGDGGGLCHRSVYTNTVPPPPSRPVHEIGEIVRAAELSNVSFLANIADGSGGAIAAQAPMSLVYSTVAGNRSTINGGGVLIAHTSRIETFIYKTDVWENTAVAVPEPGGRIAFGDGGGIFATGLVCIVASDLHHNHAGGAGGGLSVGGTSALVSQSTIAENSSRFSGGGIAAGVGGVGARAGQLVVLNSTISGNRSYRGTGGAVLRGTPGVFARPVELLSVTVTGNRTGSGTTANLETFGKVLLRNTQISAPVGGRNCTFDEPVTEGGHNLEDRHDCGLPLFDSFLDLRLEPLARNGGFARTHALGDGSPAIDAVPATLCDEDTRAGFVWDERGMSRPQGAGCDVGAFEVDQGMRSWAEGGGLISLLPFVADLVTTSAEMHLELGKPQQGEDAGEELTKAAKALYQHVNLALHTQDQKSGLALLSDAQPLAEMAKAIGLVGQCCGGYVNTRLSFISLEDAAGRFARALALATGKPPTPVEK